jgi:hypothetical protein
MRNKDDARHQAHEKGRHMSAPNDPHNPQTLPPEQPSTPPGQQPSSPENAPTTAPAQPAYPTAPGSPPAGAPSGYSAPPGAPPTAPRQRSPLSFVLGLLAGVLLLGLIAAALYYLGPGQSVVRETRATATVTATTTTPPSTPTLAATATPTERIIYQDSLTTSGSGTGWSLDPACAFKPDGLHVIGLVICFAPPDALADGTLTVTLKQVSGATNRFGGIVFRRLSTGSYYITQIDGQGHWSLDKVVNGTHTSLVAQQSSPAIRMGTGASNTLTVRMVGGRFTIAANGTPLGSATDATFASGLIGLVGDAESDVVFTDLTITAPRS